MRNAAQNSRGECDRSLGIAQKRWQRGLDALHGVGTRRGRTGSVGQRSRPLAADAGVNEPTAPAQHQLRGRQ